MQEWFQLLQQHLVEQVGGGLQGLVQGLEAGGGESQLLGVARKAELRAHGFLDEVGEVLQVERGQVAGLVGEAHGAEGGFQVGHVVEAAGFGQETTVADAWSQRQVLILQEANDRSDGSQVAVLQTQHPLGVVAKGKRTSFNSLENPPQSRCRKQPQHQLQAHIGLRHIEAAPAQKPLDVSRGRIRGVELRERRREKQDAGRSR